MKIIRPPFAYYGGKTRMAKDIVALIPTDAKNYVEPFAGSLAVLLRKEPHTCEVVNDLDNRLVGFWRTLRDKPAELQHALTLTPYARAEFEHALSIIDDPCDDVEFARRVFVILKQSRKRSTSATPGKFRSVGGSRGAGREYAASIGTFADVAERLRHVVVENIGAGEIIKRWDRTDTVFYLDPPYVGETRTNRDYTLENHSVEFHEELVQTILDAKARVILSGYDHPVYARLGDWRRIDMQRQTGSALAATRHATETLWMNF